MSDDQRTVARTAVYDGTPAERMRELQNERPRVESLRAHPYVIRVEDVSFGDDRELLEVSFRGVVPEPFTAMPEVSIVTCWIDTAPGLWASVIGHERARKYGLGSECLTALVEVDRDA
jgi:hypothetical protein